MLTERGREGGRGCGGARARPAASTRAMCVRARLDGRELHVRVGNRPGREQRCEAVTVLTSDH